MLLITVITITIYLRGMELPGRFSAHGFIPHGACGGQNCLQQGQQSTVDLVAFTGRNIRQEPPRSAKGSWLLMVNDGQIMIVGVGGY